MKPQADEMLSIAEAARRLGISGHMLSAIIRAKQIKPFAPYPGAKRKRIWASELARYCESKREE